MTEFHVSEEDYALMIKHGLIPECSVEEGTLDDIPADIMELIEKNGLPIRHGITIMTHQGPPIGSDFCITPPYPQPFRMGGETYYSYAKPITVHNVYVLRAELYARPKHTDGFVYQPCKDIMFDLHKIKLTDTLNYIRGLKMVPLQDSYKRYYYSPKGPGGLKIVNRLYEQVPPQ